MPQLGIRGKAHEPVHKRDRHYYNLQIVKRKLRVYQKIQILIKNFPLFNCTGITCLVEEIYCISYLHMGSVAFGNSNSVLTHLKVFLHFKSNLYFELCSILVHGNDNYIYCEGQQEYTRCAQSTGAVGIAEAVQ